MNRLCKIIQAGILVSAMLFGCSQNNTPKLDNTSITENEKFNSVNVDISINDFNNLGFTFGDSLNVSFTNGYELNDIPYYNGYYVRNDMPLVVGYPGYDNISITRNNTGLWTTAKLNKDDKVTITMNTKGKYLATQEALGQNYSVSKNEGENDEQFCNFRELKSNTLKENMFYRGASPVDNSRNRASYVDALLKKHNIGYIIDLADSSDDIEDDMKKAEFNSPYAKSLYENGKISLLSMGSGFSTDAYKKSVVKGFRDMLKNDGPYYIHCLEGKDRTGFVCLLIEALSGASYEDMCADYMKTYENYYGITKEKTRDRYDAVVSLYFDSFMEYLHGTDDIEVLKKADYSLDVEKYLLEGGMTEDEIKAFSSLIKKA